MRHFPLLIGTALLAGHDVSTDYGRERTLRIESEATITLETTSFEMLVDGVPVDRPFGGGGMSVQETRRVVLASRSRDNVPEFDVAAVGSRDAGLRTYRVRNDGVYLVSESRGGEDYTYDPPFRILPHPLHTDDEWIYDGARMNSRHDQSSLRSTSADMISASAARCPSTSAIARSLHALDRNLTTSTVSRN